jgi:hypothetical protein
MQTTSDSKPAVAREQWTPLDEDRLLPNGTLLSEERFDAFEAEKRRRESRIAAQEFWKEGERLAQRSPWQVVYESTVFRIIEVTGCVLSVLTGLFLLWAHDFFEFDPRPLGLTLVALGPVHMLLKLLLAEEWETCLWLRPGLVVLRISTFIALIPFFVVSAALGAWLYYRV